MLPAGTALAATPATPAPAVSTSAAPAPESTTPAPEPTPTDPTTGSCPVLPLAPFGDPGDAVGRVTLGPRGSACFTVTVEKPGLHQLRGADSLSATLSTGGTPVTCPALGYGTPCDLAAGTYRLDLVRPDDHEGEEHVTLIPLMAGRPGCTGPDSTDIGAPPVTGTSTSDVGIVCHTFTAASGALVKTELRPTAFANVDGWIADDTGRRICTVGFTCVLPAGTGAYRVLARLDPSPAPYTLKVRRLSDPVGCAVASVTGFGSAPAVASPLTACRTFTPATTGPYVLDTIDTDGIRRGVELYAPTGRICESSTSCGLTAGVTYTLIGGDPLQILDLRSTDGCADVALARPRRDTLAVPGETDCVNLPMPRDSQAAVLTGPSAVDGVRTDVTVVDADGTTLCWTEEVLTAGTCVLDGPAPYRALVQRSGDTLTGAYGLVAHRTDTASDCRPFPAGDFGAHQAGVRAMVDADAFADCLTIPADAHAGRELLQVTDARGGIGLDVSVLDENGKPACALDHTGDIVADCVLTPGLSHTVLLGGGYRPAEHTLVRRDVTGTARGCVETPATRVGAPALDGVAVAPGTFLCHRVTTDDPQDTLHLNVRYTSAGLGTGFEAYTADGEVACEAFAAGCAVTGSTAYQAIVRVSRGDTTAPAYRVDAFRIGTADGPAPECVRVPDITYGIDALTDTLSEQRPALCAALPTASGDWFRLWFTPTLTESKSPTPWLYDGVTRRNVCDWTSSGYFDCIVRGGEDGHEYGARHTTLVIGLPSIPQAAPVEVRAKVACPFTCGTVTRTVGAVTPSTVVASSKATMRVTGAALHEKDVVEVASGSYRARSTTVSVAPDRRTMEVSLDLSGAPRAALGLSVLTHDGTRYSLGTVTVVAPLSATAAPSVVGTAVVGGTVTAKAGTWSPAPEAYAYQWKADGADVAGATGASYTVPAALFGKQLSVAVTARKAGHPVVTATSAAVVVKGVAPKPVKAPYMTGWPRVGGKVTAVVGTWSPAPTGYAYQWRANGVAIAGATGASYVPVASVLGKKVTVTVTALRTGHLSGAATTTGYTVAAGLAPTATKAPYVTGTVRVGRTLSVNRGTWTPAPTAYGYQWYANGRAISGATKSWFTPTKAQRGTRITVKVTAYRTGHAAGVAWTRATGAVAG
ncbi:hypothetical protein ACGFYZ_13245 [Streptomyces sp. NPDC048330]|uniref:hypothetical protein n=1 Tax=Streptomyces sp. NPDC048330 TaxID=3365533 RepID=UPI0037133D2A